MSENSRKPVLSRRLDRVELAVWRKEVDRDGGDREHFSITLSRSYRDSEGRWQRTHRFDPRDLPHLKLAVEVAIQELLIQERPGTDPAN